MLRVTVLLEGEPLLKTGTGSLILSFYIRVHPAYPQIPVSKSLLIKRIPHHHDATATMLHSETNIVFGQKVLFLGSFNQKTFLHMVAQFPNEILYGLF